MTIKDYARVNNTRLYYTTEGQGDPIIFLHGGFTDHRVWQQQIETFSANYQVIRFDQRGYGCSDIPREPFSYYEDLKQFLDYLHLSKVTLIGSSFGGSVVIDFALKYPEQVESLILVGPALNGYHYPLRYNAECMKFFFTVQKEGFSVAIEKFISNSFWNYFFPPAENKTTLEMLLKIVRESDKAFSWNPQLVKVLKPVAAKRLSEINIPTLVVLGSTDSKFNLKVGTHIHQKIKNAKKVVIPDCGHLPYLEKPMEFNKIVFDYLKEHSPKSV